jgi:hypothetical protein
VTQTEQNGQNAPKPALASVQIDGAVGLAGRPASEEACRPTAGIGSAGGAGEVGGDDVGGVPVEGDSSAVVAHGRARVGVRGGFLHVT